MGKERVKVRKKSLLKRGGGGRGKEIAGEYIPMPREGGEREDTGESKRYVMQKSRK